MMTVMMTVMMMSKRILITKDYNDYDALVVVLTTSSVPAYDNYNDDNDDDDNHNDDGDDDNKQNDDNDTDNKHADDKHDDDGCCRQ